jgi:nucleoside-diphosphate-sugar epimerase
MTVVGDGLQTRDYTNVLDVVNINIAAAITPSTEACGEIFNVGTGISHSVLDIVEMLDSGNFEYIPARPGEARDTLADISKSNTILKWKPQIELKKWINNYKKEIGI